MKISDQGFSERISTPSSRTQSTTDSGRSTSSSVSSRYGSASDNVQFSGLASRLQNTSSLDASRTARVTQIAKAVNSNSFRVDAMQISKAMVSEAVGSQAA